MFTERLDLCREKAARVVTGDGSELGGVERGFDEFEECGFDREVGRVGTEGDAVDVRAQGGESVDDAKEPAEGAVAFESRYFQEGVRFGNELGKVGHIGRRKTRSGKMEQLNFRFGRSGHGFQ